MEPVVPIEQQIGGPPVPADQPPVRDPLLRAGGAARLTCPEATA